MIGSRFGFPLTDRSKIDLRINLEINIMPNLIKYKNCRTLSQSRKDQSDRKDLF